MTPRRVLCAVVIAAAMGGCGSSKKAAGGTNGETVSVLYAGSLVNLMERDVGPAFSTASGYRFEGVGAGSTELVAQIKNKIRRGDVFISASPAANVGLEGSANGAYVSWYVTFAQAPLVLGYNPHSPYAAEFRSKPWYQVISAPGIRVGRTDPKLDPKGKLTVTAVERAAITLHMPALITALPRSAVFPEESLVGRLQAGQLDAGFFYANEAREAHIPTVPLAPVAAHATYTVTILKGAPDPGGAQAFVSYLLGPTGRSTLVEHGLTPLAPTLTGSTAALPPGLRSVVSGG